MTRRKCLVLGAGGLVGQRLQQRLANHPMFEIVAVAGSPSSADKQLSSIPWRLDELRPNLPGLIVIDANNPNLAQQCQAIGVELAFSGLPSAIAQSVEQVLVDAGITVYSNSSAYRRKPNVPMIIPEINPHHNYSSKHYCATNCTLIPLALPVAAITKLSAIVSVKMRSEQALSGAGWQLLFDQQALSGNVNPNIDGEAEKTSAELLHVLGSMQERLVTPAEFSLDVKCKRIARRDGHQVFVTIKTQHSLELREIIQQLQALEISQELPSKPKQAIHLVDQINPADHLWSNGENFSSNPNPSDDLKTGMAVVVGDLSVEGDTVSFNAYSHNTIRGAAGGLVYLAEFLLQENS